MIIVDSIKQLKMINAMSVPISVGANRQWIRSFWRNLSFQDSSWSSGKKNWSTIRRLCTYELSLTIIKILQCWLFERSNQFEFEFFHRGRRSFFHVGPPPSSMFIENRQSSENFIWSSPLYDQILSASISQNFYMSTIYVRWYFLEQFWFWISEELNYPHSLRDFYNRRF